ncbi:hypothetical protein ACWCPT_29370 [Streptomyces sp. NPDC002308]
MPNRQLTTIDECIALLQLIGGQDVPKGATGYRVTIAPIPMGDPDSTTYLQAMTTDIPAAGFDDVVDALKSSAHAVTRYGAIYAAAEAARRLVGQMELGADQ